MQIILTEEEYNKLKNSNAVQETKLKLEEKFKAEFNRLANVVAKNYPMSSFTFCDNKQQYIKELEKVNTLSLKDVQTLKDLMFKD